MDCLNLINYIYIYIYRERERERERERLCHAREILNPILSIFHDILMGLSSYRIRCWGEERDGYN